MTKKVTEFKVGDRVGFPQYEDEDTGELTYGLRYEEYGDNIYGVITDVVSGGKLLVHWDDEDLNNEEPYSGKLSANQLMLESEMKVKLSALEVEFKDVNKQIAQKMKDAAKLLREANKLAKKQGYELANMYDAIDPLYSAMEACGWRTSSSFGC